MKGSATRDTDIEKERETARAYYAAALIRNRWLIPVGISRGLARPRTQSAPTWRRLLCVRVQGSRE